MLMMLIIMSALIHQTELPVLPGPDVPLLSLRVLTGGGGRGRGRLGLRGLTSQLLDLGPLDVVVGLPHLWEGD